ncbi:hypothetical protein HHI36_013381 [Cryptolaemus montrouzieri]|uniref:PiggyBac transposable element-derived protein domain-containing protein n=1 Tax=Cryptolaemus montrouzieri TaxID=559131 RepID=A0ABD2NH49_9CUCU
MKIYALVDAETFYIVHLAIDFELEFFEFDSVERERNITMDNLFTSQEAAEYLLKKHKLTIVDTSRVNKACIPPYLKQPRELYSSSFDCQKEVISFIMFQSLERSLYDVNPSS